MIRFHKQILFTFTGCYKGVSFCIPHESGDADGFVDAQHDIAKYELDSIEERFKEMNLIESSDSEEEREVDFEGLNDISLAEYQQNIAWRNEV